MSGRINLIRMIGRLDSSVLRAFSIKPWPLRFDVVALVGSLPGEDRCDGLKRFQLNCSRGRRPISANLSADHLFSRWKQGLIRRFELSADRSPNSHHKGTKAQSSKINPAGFSIGAILWVFVTRWRKNFLFGSSHEPAGFLVSIECQLSSLAFSRGQEICG